MARLLLARQPDNQEGTKVALFQKILCPVDFDDSSLKAVRLARRLAQREEGMVYLLHIVEPTDPLVVSAPLIERRNETDSRVLLKQIVAAELVGVQHETLLRQGSPAAETVRAANEVKADLIVMATHARHGFSHLVLGSVTEKVVRESSCPVLTVRMEDNHTA
jgi:universal stress protein A